MKWKKVSDHPLPDGGESKFYIMKIPYLDGYIYESTKYPKAHHENKGYNSHLKEWCEFNPDEIESGDCLPTVLNQKEVEEQLKECFDAPDFQKGESKYKSATEVMGEFRAKQEAAMNQALFAKRMIDEPSWEEKFRWETAARMFCTSPIACAINKGSQQPELDAKYSVQCADELIKELKRGRE